MSLQQPAGSSNQPPPYYPADQPGDKTDLGPGAYPVQPGYPPQPQPGQYPPQPQPGQYPPQQQPGQYPLQQQPGQYPPQQQPGQYPPQQQGYPVQGAPVQHGTHSTTTVVTQPGPVMVTSVAFGETPVNLVCSYCQASIVTSITEEPGTMAWLMCLLLCCIGCDLGCCFIPFCVCNDVKHHCPNCKNHLGDYRRM